MAQATFFICSFIIIVRTLIQNSFLSRYQEIHDFPLPFDSVSTSPRFRPYNGCRSYQDQRGHSPESNHSCQRIQTNNNDSGRTATRSNASQYSHEGDSTSDPSPTSPITPSSTLSEYGSSHYYPYNNTKGNVNKEYPDRIINNHHHHHHHQHHQHHQWSNTPHPDRHGLIMERPETISVRRNSSSDGDSSSQPHRPW